MCRTLGPTLYSPGTITIIISVTLPLSILIFYVFRPVCTLNNFFTRFGLGCSSGSKFPLIKKINANDNILQIVGF